MAAAWYAQRFELVELNSSFYAVPDRSTVHGWVEVTPPGFEFDVKAHRALSRHSAPVDSLPPDLRDMAETSMTGPGPADARPRDRAGGAAEETALLAEAVAATAPALRPPSAPLLPLLARGA